MSYFFVKQYSERCEVTKVLLNFMKYGHLNKVEKSAQNCGLCGYKFQKKDSISLAMVKDRGNELICDKCANQAINSGVEWEDLR